MKSKHTHNAVFSWERACQWSFWLGFGGAVRTLPSPGRVFICSFTWFCLFILLITTYFTNELKPQHIFYHINFSIIILPSGWEKQVDIYLTKITIIWK